jgi:hypothetical protein
VNEHPRELGGVGGAAALARAVRARDLEPEEHAHLVGQGVDPWVDPGDVDAHEVRAELANGLEVPPDLVERRGPRLVQDPVEVDRLPVQVEPRAAGLELAQPEPGLDLRHVPVLADQLGDGAVERGLRGRPRRGVGDPHDDVLAVLAGVEIERRVERSAWPVGVQLGHDDAEPVAAGVADPGGDAELDETFPDMADDAQARPEPVPLDRLEPHAPDRPADRLVPDAAALVDA